MSLAKQRVAQEVGSPPRKGTLVVVDYTKPSSEKRLTVVDLGTGVSKMNSRVAHGVNSGLLYATDFSNTTGSRKSSLGLYELAEEFRGSHGTSFRLDGLDPGLNTNARRRGIIVHSADYATVETMRENRSQHYRLGRSAGCLALSERDLAKLDRKLVRPAYVFAYAPVLAQRSTPSEAPGPRTPARPTITSTPQPVLVSAPIPEKEAPARERLPDKPAVERPAAPRQAMVSQPDFSIPAVIETGPVARDRDEMPAPLLTVSLSRP